MRQPRLADELTVLFSRFVEECRKSGDESRNGHLSKLNRQRASVIRKLQRRGVRTVADLLAAMPALPLKLQYETIKLTWLLKIRRAVSVLLRMMHAPKVRLACGIALGILGSHRQSTKHLLEIAHRELESPEPDPLWLESVVHALRNSPDLQTATLFVCLLERVDLPGWLRGDVADFLAHLPLVKDRRRSVYRRSRLAALKGLDEESIHVQFGSMFLIASLCNTGEAGNAMCRNFACVLPRLRQIAANDQRLSPGFWWPMSAEAEDAIGCIETGSWPHPDAGDRWYGNPGRGVWERP